MKIKRVLALILVVVIIVFSFSGCALFKNTLHSLKGKLIGVSYNIDFYDNYGAKFLNVTGKNIDINGNVVEELGVDSSGNVITTYTLSSVVTIDIDGKQIQSCGNTVIFAQTGLEPDVNFTLSDIESESSNSVTSLTSASRVVNKYKNYFGKPQVVVIQSQLGVPICAFSGKDVYWEIPDDLPKTTKLMIDGKALYVHRANFEIVDLSLIS